MTGTKPNWTSLESYELRSGRWSRKIAREFLAWLRVDEDREWLDVGCGSGALLQAILEKKRPKRVVGCDRSEGAYSGRCRSAIPGGADHRFRSMPITIPVHADHDSGVIDQTGTAL